MDSVNLNPPPSVVGPLLAPGLSIVVQAIELHLETVAAVTAIALASRQDCAGFFRALGRYTPFFRVRNEHNVEDFELWFPLKSSPCHFHSRRRIT